MIESDASSYQSSQFAKALCVSEAKVGKSSYLIASALGVLPWQKYGGVVDDPSNLHVITFDANAAGGIARFLTETCGATAEALKFRIYNLQEEARQVSMSDTDMDFSFYNAVNSVLDTIGSRAKGVPVVLISSITGLAASLERAIAGPPKPGKAGTGMDKNKWPLFSSQLAELRNLAQVDKWHTLWEGHIFKPSGDNAKETLQVSGKSGQNFGYNVEQIFRIRRNFGNAFTGSKVDTTYLDTKPSLDFVSNGRGFTEALDAKEPDLTVAFKKLGLKVGRWGAKTKT